MEAIDKAIVAQNWLMQYYHQWIPLDSCLALIHSIDDAAQQKDALDGAKATVHEHNFESGLHCSVCGEAQF